MYFILEVFVLFLSFIVVKALIPQLIVLNCDWQNKIVFAYIWEQVTNVSQIRICMTSLELEVTDMTILWRHFEN